MKKIQNISKLWMAYKWCSNGFQKGPKMSLGNFAFYSYVFQICWASETRHLWCRKSGKKKSSKSNIMTRFCMIVMLQFSLGEVERGKNWPLWHKRPFVPWITNKLLLSCFTMLRLIFQDYTKNPKLDTYFFASAKWQKTEQKRIVHKTICPFLYFVLYWDIFRPFQHLY